MNTTGMLWCLRWDRSLCLALIVLSSSMSARALSCVAPDALIERTLRTAEPPFPEAEVVIYAKVVELLSDKMAKAGLKRTAEGSSLARVRVIEGFRGAVAGQVLELRTDDRIVENRILAVSDPEQLMVAERGVVAPCLQFQLKRAQLVELRRHFQRYPYPQTPNKAR